MNEVYVVAGRRRTLHRAARFEGGLATKEGCNIDSAKPREIYIALAMAERNAKRTCARCFSKETTMTDDENEQTAEEAGLEPDLEDAPENDSGMAGLAEEPPE